MTIAHCRLSGWLAPNGDASPSAPSSPSSGCYARVLREGASQRMLRDSRRGLECWIGYSTANYDLIMEGVDYHEFHSLVPGTPADQRKWFCVGDRTSP